MTEPSGHVFDPLELSNSEREDLVGILERAGYSRTEVALSPIWYCPATGEIEFLVYDDGALVDTQAVIRDAGDQRWLAALAEVLQGPQPAEDEK